MSVVKPSAMREVAIDVPKVRFAVPRSSATLSSLSLQLILKLLLQFNKKRGKKRPRLNAIGELAAALFGPILQDLGKRYFKSLIPLVRTQERLLAL